MNRIFWATTISGLGLGLLALSWPARIGEQTSTLHCQPGTELIFAPGAGPRSNGKSGWAGAAGRRFSLSGVPWWVKAKLGSRDLPVDRQWSGFRLKLPADLKEGSEQLRIQVGGVRPQEWTCQIVVDGDAPRIKWLEPAPNLALAAETVDLVGFAEGHFRMQLPLAPGWNTLKLSARDAAGNTARLERKIFSDQQPPSLTLERLLPDGTSEPLRGKDSPKDSFKVRVILQDDSGVDRLCYRQDGQSRWTTARLSHQQGVWQAVFPLRGLPEGTRHLEFEAIDRAGRKTAEDAEFLVDSSEKLGQKFLTPGARGEDVVQLQQRLNEAGMLGKASINGQFDQTTEKAIRRFQKQEGLPVTGRVGTQTLLALGPRVFVNLAAFELVLDRPGEELVRYSIACGQPAWPTPTGRFKVFDKVRDPSWIPPDSPWAREAETIPPGPGNPLGTRWIGLDWGGVGIHGTNADWSIGSASSHGCLRMHIYDVEALYEMLGEGTPVTIFGGWEKDPMLRRYWPFE